MSKVAFASIVFASLLLIEAVFAEDLFQESHRPISADEEREVYDDRAIVRSRVAALDTVLLIGSVAAGEPVNLNLFRDVEFRAAFEQPVRPSSSGGAFMYGRLEHGGHVTLFVGEGGIVRGEVHSPGGVYTVRNSKGRARGGGDVTIKQIDTARLPVVDHGAARMERPSRAAYSAALSAIDEADEGETEEPPDETVDLLVVYTPAAESHEGGREEIEATIAAEVEKTNQAFDNSGLSHRKFKMVGAERVDYTQSDHNMSDNLQVLKDWKGAFYDPDGVLDEVHELGERTGADLVHIFVERSIGTCGVASNYDLFTKQFVANACASDPNPDACVVQKRKEFWRGRSFSASAIPEGCTIQDTFTHELGHNFGLYHDRYAENKYDSLRLTRDGTNRIEFPLRPYGFGYVNQNFSRSACFRTIMSYGDQCVDEGYTVIPQALMFSNPDSEIGNEEVGFDPAGVEGEEWTVELDGPVSAARAIDDVWDIVANLYTLTETGHAVPFMPSASAVGRQGFVRVVNHSKEAGEVAIEAFDDSGNAYDPVTLAIGADETVHFNSDDLEMGNSAKGLSGGVGASEGDWRLKLTSLLDIEVLAYIRTEDGFLTAMHDLMPASGPGRRSAFFNPGSNESQVSLLRLANPRDEEAAVAITGVDDDGEAGGEVRVVVPARGALAFTAGELESGGEGLEGALRDGAGKWRLFVEAERVRGGPFGQGTALPWILAMSLLESPTGHLTNLSSIPRNESLGVHSVPLFPAKSAAGRQGFARVVNRSDEAGEATITAYDDAGREYGPVTLALAANGAAHFNSDDLEDGSAAKGLSGGIGSGEGDWRLEVTSDLDIDVLAYVRTDDGFVTTMHDAAPSLIHTHRAPTFNPGSNADQVSSLRLVNPGEDDAEVTIIGTDGDGVSPGSDIRITVPAKASRTLTAQELESGGIGFEGALGDGAGKWELEIRADREIVAMSLLESPTGHLTNLSTAPVRGAGPWPPPDEEEEN